MYKIMTPGPTQVRENVRMARSLVCTNPDLDEEFVTFYKETVESLTETDEETERLLLFCKTPRTRKEICEYLGLSSGTYAMKKYILPLVESGEIKLTIPEKPKSHKQMYYRG